MIDKVRYIEWYRAHGNYRKQLLREEAVDSARMYDRFSQLLARLSEVSRCRELRASGNPTIARMLGAAEMFQVDLRSAVGEVFAHSGDDLNRKFAETYDTAASIVEGFEAAAGQELEKMHDLSEDAQLIQRRTHFQRKAGGGSARRSLAVKQAWARGKERFKTGIKKFHQSTQGKAFHRNLARYNRRRMENHDFTSDDVLMTCKGLSSMLTHVLIEIENLRTQDAGRGSKAVAEDSMVLKEFFGIFQEALGALVDAAFDGDKEAVADIVGMVADYYELAGAGDAQISDIDATDKEVSL